MSYSACHTAAVVVVPIRLFDDSTRIWHFYLC